LSVHHGKPKLLRSLARLHGSGVRINGYHGPMPPLTRRRDLDTREEAWLIFYGDVHVGTISTGSRNPAGGDQWSWHCGFYPGSNPGDGTNGTATDFDAARTAQVARRCSGSLREIGLLVFPLEAAVTAVLVVTVPKVCLLLLVCIPLLVREHDVQIHL
jgi:hypothetical protein